MNLSRSKKTAIIAFLFGSFMLYHALQLEPLFPLTEGDCGPGFFPAFASVGIMISALGKFFIPIGEQKDKRFLSKEGWLKAGLMCLWLIFYVVCLKWFGFLLSSIVGLFLLVRLFAWKEKVNYLVTAIYSVIFPVLVYILFMYVLNQLLPTGKLF